MSENRAILDALREIRILAAEDRRRGIEYWYDAELAEALRALAMEALATRPVSEASGIRSASSGSGVEAVTAQSGDWRAKARARAHGETDAADSPESKEVPKVSSPKTAVGAGRKSPSAPKVPEWGPAPEAKGRPRGWKTRLAEAAAQAAVCRDCGLCRTRTQVVFGAGQATTPLVFVGEAPGADEDAQGIPFVGRAGQLLTKIIAAIGLDREQVYITNILKCRPPKNRNPLPDEIAACRKYLDLQLDLLRPTVVCTLGLFSSQMLLDSQESIGKLRGRAFRKDGRIIVPTYHPAALLRNPSLKAAVWEDVQKMRRILDGTEEV